MDFSLFVHTGRRIEKNKGCETNEKNQQQPVAEAAFFRNQYNGISFEIEIKKKKKHPLLIRQNEPRVNTKNWN